MLQTNLMAYQWLRGSALELVDGKYRVQSSVALVDLTVRSFPAIFSETRLKTG